jgi:mannose-6-phosphate isomerase-like protein (cupin superfamily)
LSANDLARECNGATAPQMAEAEMTASRKSTEALLNAAQCNSEWLETTPGERFRIRTTADETNGIYTMLEIVADPRNGVPMHIHKNEEEHFIVLEGAMHIANGAETMDVPAGRAVTVGRGVAHAWCNLEDFPLRMLVVFSPGHIEGLFRSTAAGHESDDIATLAEKYGTLLVGPPLFDDVYSISSPRPQAALGRDDERRRISARA